MSNLSANQQVVRAGKHRNAPPCAANVHHYEGGIVFVNSSGYADVSNGSGANKVAGVCLNEFDNTGGANGAANPATGATGVECAADDAFLLNGSGFSQATVGVAIYAADTGTVTTTSTNNSRFGTCVGYVSSTQIWVRFIHQ